MQPREQRSKACVRHGASTRASVQHPQAARRDRGGRRTRWGGQKLAPNRSVNTGALAGTGCAEPANTAIRACGGSEVQVTWQATSASSSQRFSERVGATCCATFVTSGLASPPPSGSRSLLWRACERARTRAIRLVHAMGKRGASAASVGASQPAAKRPTEEPRRGGRSRRVKAVPAARTFTHPSAHSLKFRPSVLSRAAACGLAGRWCTTLLSGRLQWRKLRLMRAAVVALLRHGLLTLPPSPNDQSPSATPTRPRRSATLAASWYFRTTRCGQLHPPPSMETDARRRSSRPV